MAQPVRSVTVPPTAVSRAVVAQVSQREVLRLKQERSASLRMMDSTLLPQAGRTTISEGRDRRWSWANTRSGSLTLLEAARRRGEERGAEEGRGEGRPKRPRVGPPATTGEVEKGQPMTPK
jgi:hypothetical protein